MKAYKCDRCGKYYELTDQPNPHSNTFVRIIQRNECGGYDASDVRQELDLCEECTRKLYLFLNCVDKEEEY